MPHQKPFLFRLGLAFSLAVILTTLAAAMALADPPVATDNDYTIAEDTNASGNVITDDTGDGVDSDAESDPFTAGLDTGPAVGTLNLNPDGSFVYTPTLNYNGVVTFTYQLSEVGMNTITVNRLADNTTSADGQCTLREALANAAAGSDTTGGDCNAGVVGMDRIDFSVTGTIVLSIGTLSANTVFIDGPGAQLLTISGNNTYRVINAFGATINGVTIADGFTPGSGGGINAAGGVTVTNSIITNNATNDHAGGMYIQNGDVSIYKSTFSNNVIPGWGGAIRQENPGTLTIVNSTFSGNSAGNGGGIQVQGTTNIIHSSFISNTNRGLQINGGVVTFTNSVFANNTGGDCAGAGTITDSGYNNVEGGGCISAGTSFSGDPLLGPLADNGGGTPTHAPLVGSPLIDVIPAGVNGCGTTYDVDQRWATRPFDGGSGALCDIGAYEYLSPAGSPPASGPLQSNIATVTITVTAVPDVDLEMTKTVNPSTAQPGDTITYTLTFVNNGIDTAPNVVITDRVPVSVTNVSVISSGVSITNTGAATDFVWNVQDLDPGDAGVITITAEISSPLAAGVFTNTATITTTSVDSDTTNNKDSAGLTVMLPLYLPLIFKNWGITPLTDLIPAIKLRPVSQRGETFYAAPLTLTVGTLPAGGKFYFSAAPDSLQPAWVDDLLVLVNKNQIDIFTYDFSDAASTAGLPSDVGALDIIPSLVEVPRAVVQEILDGGVTVEFRDVYGGYLGSSNVWLIWVP